MGENTLSLLVARGPRANPEMYACTDMPYIFVFPHPIYYLRPSILSRS